MFRRLRKSVRLRQGNKIRSVSISNDRSVSLTKDFIIVDGVKYEYGDDLPSGVKVTYW